MQKQTGSVDLMSVLKAQCQETADANKPKDYDQWTTFTGDTVEISRMDSQHVFNALDLCRLNAEGVGRQAQHAKEYIKRFSRELIKRSKILDF
jgi:hypothetical protein